MIESIYSKENGKLKEWSKSNVMFRMPKNIRQIGKIIGNKKVYVEDYVITYVKQLADQENENETLAVLLGQYIKMDNSKNIFISGAIEIKISREEENSTFTNEIWTSIYEDIKQYFTDIEIVGWFYTKPGAGLEVTDELTKIHLDNFAGQDKTLLIYDSAEQDEAFYVYDNNKLARMQGYYIYYEKNEEMQSYMVDNNKNKNIGIESEFDDKTVRDIRSILAAKQELNEELAGSDELKSNIPRDIKDNPKVKKNGQGKSVHLLYGASTLMAVTVLVVGAAVIDNYDKMRNVEEALGVISESIVGGHEEDNLTEVETVSGQIGDPVDDTLKSIEELNKNSGSDSNKENNTTQELTENKNNANIQESSESKNNDNTQESSENKNNATTQESSESKNNDNTQESTESKNNSNTKETDETQNTAESTMQEFDSNNSEKSNTNEDAIEDKKDTSNKESSSESNNSNEVSSKSNEKTNNEQKNSTSKDDAATAGNNSQVKTTSTGETRYYIVKEGDTLADISIKIYKTIHRVNDIQKANQLVNQDKILVGQKLIIP